MKNNLILIAVVTLISIVIIVISIVIGKNNGGESSQYESLSNTEKTDIIYETEEVTEAPPETVKPIETEATQEEQSAEETAEEYSDETADAIIGTARALIGIDFYQGGTEPTVGFDNSGFIYYVLRENGFITCPRSISEQTGMGTKVSYNELKRGDLVYFTSEGDDTPGYGGIYAGDGIMITCQMPGTKVKEVNITTNYYRENFYSGVNII